MKLLRDICRTPIPYDAEIGAEVAAGFAAFPAPARELIAGAAGCSPYLQGLLLREADWLHSAADSSADEAMASMLRATAALRGADLKGALRRQKRRVALLTALADLGGIWKLEQVTGALGDFADAAVDVALRDLVAAEVRRDKLPGVTPAMLEDDPAGVAGMSVLGMGKLGAGELNYSSDIDLICLFDDTRFDGPDVAEARAVFVRVTRRMAAMLSDITNDGYVFRTDLRLRPDPSVTPVCLSTTAAERYYESVGRNWERAAYIKARACAGDLDVGRAFLRALTPFVWRKHLDFAAIQDAHDMRLRIREHKGLRRDIVLADHDMKLGPGGIREIEFFVQTHQLVSGGRDPGLRARGTLAGLHALSAAGWIAPDCADALHGHYLEHREVEHRLQMINDAQTHRLPSGPEGFDRLARFMGEADTQRFQHRLKDRLLSVAAWMDPFFAPDSKNVPQEVEITPEMKAIVERWPTYPALRSERAAEIFEWLRPEILDRLGKAARPQEALIQFDLFLQGLPAGVQLFALFKSNSQLVDLLVDICATAPGLAQYLSRNAAVLDAVLGGSFFEDWPGVGELSAMLTRQLDAIEDYEKQLDEARRWCKEWNFRIGVHHLRGLIDAGQAGRQYGDLAEAVVAALWQPVQSMFAARHGAPPGKGASVIAMGSLGASRLNAASDLDLIVIYDADGVENSDGKRSLASRSYYARLTQALVTALSAPMAQGRLYEVDMRLRPSGRQGPVATSLASFEAYQRDEAWTWEHLALTRARPVAGSAELGARIDAFRRDLLSDPHDPGKILRDLADMRRRLAEAKPGGGVWDPKAGSGRMQDIELFGQGIALLAGSPDRTVHGQVMAGVAAGLIAQTDAQAVLSAYDVFVKVQQVVRLVTHAIVPVADLGRGAVEFLLRETGRDGIEDLASHLSQQQHIATQIIEGFLTSVQEQTAAKGSLP
ncbi:[protein-PII] uridylyltransferase family protein [Brevirhabdus sp.]|uniref:[protein-PII] uridylyltransferase family protein n=1 Tax=Brevirhabdus sp. TaxID=2004514 RepID=UPI004058D216